MADVIFVRPGREIDVTHAEAKLIATWTDDPPAHLSELRAELLKAVGEPVRVFLNEGMRAQLVADIDAIEQADAKEGRGPLSEGLRQARNLAAAPD